MFSSPTYLCTTISTAVIIRILCIVFYILCTMQVSTFKYYNYVNLKTQFFWRFCSSLLSSSSHLESGDTFAILWLGVLFCFNPYKVERIDFILPTRLRLLSSSHQRQLLALHFDQAPFKGLCRWSWISMASISATRLEICIRAFWKCWFPVLSSWVTAREHSFYCNRSAQTAAGVPRGAGEWWIQSLFSIPLIITDRACPVALSADSGKELDRTRIREMTVCGL